MKTSSIYVILSVVGMQKLGRCIVGKQQNSKQRSLLITLSLVGFVIIILLIWKVPQQQAKDITDCTIPTKQDCKDSVATKKDHITTENAVRSTLVQGLGGIFLFVTAYFAWRNVKVAEEKQVTERFAKAVEQLGSENIHVRIGAIYALERIAKDSDKDYWQVMEVLTAYVRERSPYPPRDNADNKPLWASVLSIHQKNNHSATTDSQKDITPITTDIQAVLTVIGRRTKSYGQGEENTLDLRKSNLIDANLSNANLSGANLQEANLSNANLSGANLSGAELFFADLNGAQLIFANLNGAEMFGAGLNGAKLSCAQLLGANLYGANLSGAKLFYAHLNGAQLNFANLSNAKLSGANLSNADLGCTNLSGANLSNTKMGSGYLSNAELNCIKLSDAELSDAELSNAELSGANLSNADLFLANLDCADMKGAKNLTPEQVKKAGSWEDAKYDKEFRIQLGLPPEPEEDT